MSYFLQLWYCLFVVVFCLFFCLFVFVCFFLFLFFSGICYILLVNGMLLLVWYNIKSLTVFELCLLQCIPSGWHEWWIRLMMIPWILTRNERNLIIYLDYLDYLYWNLPVPYKHSIGTQGHYRTEVSLFHARLECQEQLMIKGLDGQEL